jgi:hypothetical protein
MPGIGILWAPPRAAGFALESFIKQRFGLRGVDDPPRAKPSLALTAQVALDEAFLGVMRNPSRYPTDADYAGLAAELSSAAALYAQEGWIANPRSYHRDPPPLTAPRVNRAWAMNVRYERLSWPSEFEPHDGEPNTARWSTFVRNRMAYAYVVRRRPDRPWLMCLHGFSTGVPTADFFAFKAKRLSEELDLNLIFPVLPLHGPRRASRMSGAELLSYNVLDFITGMAQAMWDIRRVLGWVRAQGGERIGVHGMSLGAYTAALLCALEPGLELLIAGAPLCDMPGLIEHHMPRRLRSKASENGIRPEVLQDVFRPVSPLAYPPQVRRERIHMYAGVGDRMSTPAQAHRLWAHWDKPNVLWYEGGHITFLWSGQVTRFLDEALATARFIEPKPKAPAAPVSLT